MTSTAKHEADAVTQGRALRTSLDELRGRLTPAAMTGSVGDALSERVSLASQTISAKAATPGGLVAMCAMAFSSAFALGGGMPKQSDDPEVRTSPPRPAAAPPVPRETFFMLGQLAVAMAAGAVASRFIPTSAAEKTLLEGVAPELKRALHTHVEEQARRLVTPSTSRFGLVNLLALGGAMALSRRKSARTIDGSA